MNSDPIKSEYDSVSHKYLSDNRRVYIAMSKMTVDGKVPTYREALERLESKEDPQRGAKDEATP